ncbi:MAG: peptidylprolyl isomerase [Candidatus Nanosalina sp.]
MAEEVHASHILVEEKDKAENVKNDLDNGKDFEQLAREVSTCPSSEKGGDLGWFGKGEMVKPFEREVFENMDVGDISDPVKTEFGFHIIRKDDKR